MLHAAPAPATAADAAQAVAYQGRQAGALGHRGSWRAGPVQLCAAAGFSWLPCTQELLASQYLHAVQYFTDPVVRMLRRLVQSLGQHAPLVNE